MSRSGSFQIVVSKDELDPSHTQVMQRFRDLSNDDHISRPYAVTLKVPSGSLENVLTQLGPAQIQAVKKSASSVRGNPSQWKQHDEDIRIALEQAIGDSLPTPAYATRKESTFLRSRTGESGNTMHKSMSETTNLLDWIQEYPRRLNLHYSAAQVATFYTALQTKGFVVLSGISGTGKSKIAQGFVKMLPTVGADQQPCRIDPELVISLTVKPYMRKYHRVIIPVKQLDLLPSMDAGDSKDLRLVLGDVNDSGRLDCRV
jgi:hypothetical protein